MIGSDVQKNATLKKRKGLISDGYFKITRNPNYLGETFIYASFVALTGNSYMKIDDLLGIQSFSVFNHIRTYSVAILVFLIVFMPRMMIKDFSLSKKKGWDEYSQRSYLILPKFSSSDLVNVGIYAGKIVLFQFLCLKFTTIEVSIIDILKNLT